MEKGSACGGLSLLFVAAMLLATPLAFAETESAADRNVALEGDEAARAKQFFDDASELRDAGDLEGAASLLRRAIALKETPGLRFHLAYVLEGLGQFEQALAEYQRARVLIKEGQQAPDVAERLPAAIDRMKAAVAAGSAEARHDAGSHRRRDAAGAAEDATDTSASPQAESAGGANDTGAQRGASPSLSDHRQGRDEKRSSSDPELAARDAAETGSIGGREIVLASEAGVAILAVGFGVLQSIEVGRADDSVVPNRRAVERLAPDEQLATDERRSVCEDPADVDLIEACRGLRVAVEDRDRARMLATTGYVVGGVAAVSFVATLLLWPSAEPDETARIGAALAPGGGGVSIAGTF